MSQSWLQIVGLTGLEHMFAHGPVTDWCPCHGLHGVVGEADTLFPRHS